MSLSARQKSAILWGAVGFMSFLVLVQGYAVLREPIVSIIQGVAVALLVGAGAALGAYLLEYRVADWSARRAMEDDRERGSGGGE